MKRIAKKDLKIKRRKKKFKMKMLKKAKHLKPGCDDTHLQFFLMILQSLWVLFHDIDVRCIAFMFFI